MLCTSWHRTRTFRVAYPKVMTNLNDVLLQHCLFADDVECLIFQHQVTWWTERRVFPSFYCSVRVLPTLFHKEEHEIRGTIKVRVVRKSAVCDFFNAITQKRSTIFYGRRRPIRENSSWCVCQRVWHVLQAIPGWKMFIIERGIVKKNSFPTTYNVVKKMDYYSVFWNNTKSSGNH